MRPMCYWLLHDKALKLEMRLSLLGDQDLHAIQLLLGLRDTQVSTKRVDLFEPQGHELRFDLRHIHIAWILQPGTSPSPSWGA